MENHWMLADRRSKEYEEGVEEFLRIALSNAVDQGRIRCPCQKCENTRKFTIRVIREHMYFNGFDQTYKDWIWHGKDIEINASETVNQEPQPERDFFGEMVDMCEGAHEQFTENPEEFKKFLEEAEKPLYPGCHKHTKLSRLVKLYNLKARHGMTDNCFADMLIEVCDLLPIGQELPLSMYEAKKTLNALGLKYEKIHACSNDCILYRKKYHVLGTCPKCGLSRWKVTKKNVVKKGLPTKVLWYFPPIPRFKHMFKSLETSKSLTWHNEARIKDGRLRHPADSPSWKMIDYKWPDFGSEPRNLSCWPVILVTYNLPPELCMKRKFIMLTLLISGPKQPGNDIDIYLEPLIDDLALLWDGVDGVYDAFRQESFTLRAILLWTINDFPTYGNLSGCTTKGYYACPICGDKTYAESIFGTLLNIPGKTKDGVAAREDLVKLGFCSEYMADLSAIGVPTSRLDLANTSAALSSTVIESVPHDKWEQAHRTILDNTMEKGIKYDDDTGLTMVNLNRRGYRKDEFVMATHVSQVFYIDDPENDGWSIVLPMPNRVYAHGDELEDAVLEHQFFTNGLPPVEEFKYELGEGDEKFALIN
ncbi:unnamed protein product [Prunus brigantina]